MSSKVGYAELPLKVHKVVEHLETFKFIENLHEIKDVDNEEINVHILSEEEALRELERQLHLSRQIAADIVTDHDLTIKNNKLLQEEIQQTHVQTKQEELELAELKRKIEQLEQEIREVENVELAEPEVNSDRLRLALYRGLGISMTVEDKTVKKAVLTSKNHQDIRTIAVSSYKVSYTSEFIWDFISH